MPPAAAARERAAAALRAAGLRGCGGCGGRGSGGAAGREMLLLLLLLLLFPLLLLLLLLLLLVLLLLSLWLLHGAFSSGGGGGGSAEQQTCRIWPGHLGGSAAQPPPWEGKRSLRKNRKQRNVSASLALHPAARGRGPAGRGAGGERAAVRSAEPRLAPTLRARTWRRMRRTGHPPTGSLAPPLPPDPAGSAASAGEAGDCTAFVPGSWARRTREGPCSPLLLGFMDVTAGLCVEKGRSRDNGSGSLL